MDLNPEMERLLERLLAGEELTREERELLDGAPGLGTRARELSEIQALLDVEGAAERTRLASATVDEGAEVRAEKALTEGLRARRAKPIAAGWWTVAAAAVVIFGVSLFALLGTKGGNDIGLSYLMLSEQRADFELLPPERMEDGAIRLSWSCEDAELSYYAVFVWGEALRVGEALFESPELEEPNWTLDATQAAAWPVKVEIEIVAYADDGSELDQVEFALQLR